MIKDAFEKYRLVKENQYLTKLTIQQNEELKKWSTELEFYVQQHTIELTNQNKELKKLNEKLKKNVSEILKSLSSLIELRSHSMRNHSNNVSGPVDSYGKRHGTGRTGNRNDFDRFTAP